MIKFFFALLTFVLTFKRIYSTRDGMRAKELINHKLQGGGEGVTMFFLTNHYSIE